MSLVDELRERSDLNAEDLAAWLMARGVGRRGGRRRRRRERPECPELGATAKRFGRALAARAAEGDTEGLEQLVEVRRALDGHIDEAARALKVFGYSWTEVSDVLGVSRQAARQRFGVLPSGGPLLVTSPPASG